MTVSIQTMTLRQASRETGIPYSTFCDACRRGDGPEHIRIGKSVRVRPEALERWMEEKERESRAQALAG